MSLRNTIKRTAGLTVTGCVAIMLTSCGSGSTSSSPSTSAPSTVARLTKSAYLARANGLCRTMNARIKALGDPGDDPVKLAQVAEATATVTAATLRQLRRLPFPTGDEAALEAVYAKVDQLLADVPELTAALRAGDRAAAREALNKVTADSDAANTASNAYGLTACGS